MASSTLPPGPTAWRIVRVGDRGYGVHFQVADGSWQAYTFDGRQVFTGPLQFSGPPIVKMIRPGDVLNIDVSAELDGFITVGCLGNHVEAMVLEQ